LTINNILKIHNILKLKEFLCKCWKYLKEKITNLYQQSQTVFSFYKLKLPDHKVIYLKNIMNFIVFLIQNNSLRMKLFSAVVFILTRNWSSSILAQPKSDQFNKSIF